VRSRRVSDINPGMKFAVYVCSCHSVHLPCAGASSVLVGMAIGPKTEATMRTLPNPPRGTLAPWEPVNNARRKSLASDPLSYLASR